ncbi:MAG: AAA family ATPase [Acidobacteria bacterium]|nr:AAA family ATPase [Acidobacteriota bacterium]
MATLTPPRITALNVRNYRALRNVALKELTPLTVLLGPNGSGKSTVFDVFAFLSECFTDGIRKAWDRRGRFRELRSRDSQGPIVVELKYRERPKTPLITYHLELDEEDGRPVVSHEFLRWTRSRSSGRPFNFMEYRRGEGEVITGEAPEQTDRRVARQLAGPDVLAVSTLGMLAENPRVIALREFVSSWHLSCLSAEAARRNPEAGGEEQLSSTGANLANVIQYLHERYPDRLNKILDVLRRRVPRIEHAEAISLADGSLALRIKDAPFAAPVLSRFASDGTLKMLAYLTLLHDPAPPRLIGVEEPENFLHPRLLPELAEECRAASERTQLLVTTHSPFFLNPMRSKEVRVLWRNHQGYTQAQRVSDIAGVEEFLQEGATPGDLWMEGQFGIGDPLVNQGEPSRRRQGRSR